MDSCTVKFMMMVNWAMPETCFPILIEKTTSAMHQWLSGFRSLISGLQVYLHFNLQLSFGRSQQYLLATFPCFSSKKSQKLVREKQLLVEMGFVSCINVFVCFTLEPFRLSEQNEKSSISSNPQVNKDHISLGVLPTLVKGSNRFLL